MKIEGKCFIVTGGASGLGEATVRKLVSLKANVAIVDVNSESGNALVKELGSQTLFVEADITNEQSVLSLIKATQEKFGDIHGAVNCAGIAAGIKVLSRSGVIPLDVFQRIINVNLIGTFNVMRLVADVIQKQKPDENGERGVFVNVASVAAYEGQQGQSAYSASKGGIVSMTLPLAREFGPLGIRVMAVAPGVFDTPMLRGLPQKAMDAISQTIPFPPRPGLSHEFADLVSHIIQNIYLNGETIRLDGAVRLAKL
eukprot:TRINITY_DN3489_c0_g5_i1.p1 TRINITY_DN3489_c0_g5~~TRINITY_DN3489_c0_g5_i1.p1  ORF type:complete len:284 (+),score=58.80 TRINITY_DN3489_c0_g5_i1:85-852(+)